MTEAGVGGDGHGGEGGILPVWASAGLWTLAALGAALRLYGVERRPVWDDEAWTYFVSSQGLDHLFAVLRLDNHPPGFYLLEAGALGLLGHGEAALRAVSLLAGLAALPVTAWVARSLWGGAAALPAAALAACSPVLIYSSQEARFYMVLAPLVLAGGWLWWRLAAEPSWRGAGAAAGVTLAALYTHYFGAFLLVFGGLCLLLRTRRGRGPMVTGLAAASAGLVPLAPLILAQRASYAGSDFEGGGYGERLSLLHTAARLLVIPGNGGYPEGLLRPAGYAVWTVLLAGTALVVAREPRLRRLAGFPLLLLAVLTTLWQGFGQLGLWPLRDNFLPVLVLPLVVLLSAVAVPLAPGGLRLALFGGLAAVLLTGSGTLAAGGGRGNPDYRSAAAFVRRAAPDALLLGRGWGDLSCMQYYTRWQGPVAAYGAPEGGTMEARCVGVRLSRVEEVLGRRRRIVLLGKSPAPGLEVLRRRLEASGYRRTGRASFPQVECSLWVREDIPEAGRERDAVH